MRHIPSFCSTLLLAAAGLAGASGAEGGGDAPPARDKLDASRAFYYPAVAGDEDTPPGPVLARTEIGPIHARTLRRYRAAYAGKGELDDLAFDILLARACRERKLARSAPTLARSLATRRFFEAGRRKSDDPDGAQRRKFLNDALRDLRAQAWIRSERTIDDWAVRALFERRYGLHGQKVRVRHVLVAFDAIASQMRARGEDASPTDVRARARERAAELRARVVDRDLTPLMRASDDRQARRLARRAATAARAGFLEGYNYVRFGPRFAAAVRALAPGEVSQPVETAKGFHLVQVTSRKTTRFEDVADALHAEMRGRKITSSEMHKLRRKLFARYAYRS